MERRRIGRFEVERTLGQGGMGVVYVARDALLDRRVALKVLPPGHDEDRADRQRLLREARSAAALSHPNVATVLEAGEEGGEVYLAMELIVGENLAERLARAPLTEGEVIHVGLGIARGLAAAHVCGVLHRDLKPANVILGPEGTPKIVDFGLARAPRRAGEPDERTSYTGIVIGTPGYMAPEQVRGGETDARTDVFALGVVLHEMWAGAPPFAGTGLAAMSAVLYEEPEPLDRRRPGPPVELRELVRRCLSRDPSGRPADASVVVRVLAALAAKTPAPASAVTLRVTDEGVVQPLAPTIEVIRSSVRPRTSLSSLVGREREIEAIEGAIAGGARLVTIAGPPGIGKTRVAEEVARRAHERGERAASVQIGSAPTLADVEAGVLAALRRASAPSTLVELLALEDGLLSLDGGEAIAESLGARIEEWLRVAPRLRVVVSSRTVLRAPSEHVVTLEPLPVEVGVELFLARAKRARPLLVVGAAEQQAAVEIVGLLDGNPLAVSLAAARASVLAPPQIAARLRQRAQDRLALLQERGATGLADAIAWSLQLLDPAARALVVELAVFAGPFDVEAAESIASDPPSVLDALERLRDASLVRSGSDEDGSARMSVDPNVRAFALRELEQRGDAAAMRSRHAAWVVGLAERALAGEPGAARTAALHAGDLAEAVAHAEGRTDALAREQGLVAATLIALHGETHDPARIATRLAALLATCEGAAPATRARAALGLRRARAHFDAEGSVRAAREALEHAARAADPRLVTRARLALVDALIGTSALAEAGAEARAALAAATDVDLEIDALDRATVIAWRESDIERALEHARRGLSLVEARRDRRRIADFLLRMGIVSVQAGRFAEARAAYERARELARAEGAVSLVATLDNNLGVVLHEQDRLDEARATFVEAAAEGKAAGRALLYAVARGNVGLVDHEAGRRADARLAYDEAIDVLVSVGDRRYRAVFHLARAALMADEGDARRARQELEVARGLIGDPPTEPQLPVVAAIRTAYVEHVLTGDPAATQALRGALAEAAHPGSVTAESDLARAALRLVRARLAPVP